MNSTCSSSSRRSVSVRYSSKARLPLEGGPKPEAEAAALHAAAHPVHLVLHPLHLVLPAILMAPATHFSAPECEKEKGKADRPPDDEAEDGHGDPAGMPGAIKHMRAIGLFRRAAPSIDICGVGHFPLHDGDHAVVNVNNIYIPKPSRIFVKRAAQRRPVKLFWECPKGLPADLAAGLRTAGVRRVLLRWPAIGREAETAQIDQHFGFQQILRPTSAACGAPHRRGRTATPRRATSTRCAAPSSSPAAAACRAAPARRAARRRRG